jgi:hypothetical protein
MLDFLAQSLCLDASGKPTSQIPIVDDCSSTRPQRGDDRAVYRKHDWPDRRVPTKALLAYQASDSVLEERAGRPVIEQVFLFGDAPGRSFERFEVGAGNVVLLVDGWASIVMTDDNTGVQWFIGEGCKQSAERGRLGWLLFNRDTPTGRWADVTPNLSKGKYENDCPAAFGPSYTRYRRENMTFPFRVVDGNRVTEVSRALDAIVTDHFGGGSPDFASDNHLERFYSARHLGLVRWERWENVNNRPSAQRQAKAAQASQLLDISDRCPTVDYSTSPGPGWSRVDCRMWTTIVKVNKPWAVNDLHWRAFEDANWR